MYNEDMIYNKEVTIKVFPDMGNCYYVTIDIDDRYDAEEQIDNWMDYSLMNVSHWKFVG